MSGGVDVLGGSKCQGSAAEAKTAVTQVVDIRELRAQEGRRNMWKNARSILMGITASNLLAMVRGCTDENSGIRFAGSCFRAGFVSGVV